MEPSKEAITAAWESMTEYKYNQGYIQLTSAALSSAYAIDVAPLETRLEEAEFKLRDREANMEILLENSRNSALEEAARVADGWDFGKPISDEIRKLKGE